MMLQKYKPRKQVPTLFRDTAFNDVFSTFLDYFVSPELEEERVWGPSLHSHVHDNEYIVSAELPGYGHDEIKVEVSDDTLKVAGKREASNGGGSLQFQKEFTIPQDVDPEQINATLEKGVLNIVLPRKQKTLREIEIK